MTQVITIPLTAWSRLHTNAVTSAPSPRKVRTCPKRYSGPMASALISRSSSLNSRLGWVHCIAFLGKTFYSQIASLYPGVLILMVGWTNIPSRGAKNTSGDYMLQKMEIVPGWGATWLVCTRHLHLPQRILITASCCPGRNDENPNFRREDNTSFVTSEIQWKGHFWVIYYY